MGIAIILTIFCHSNVSVSIHALSSGYFLLINICQVGVDIFLFLSGMGCCYSMQKCKTVVKFYKRRLLRVFTTYFLIVPIRIFVDIIVDDYTLISAIRRYSLVSFFLDGVLATWFIAGLILLYLLFPLLYCVLKKNENVFLLIILVYIMAICLKPYLRKKGIIIPGVLERDIFYIRVLPFLLGMYYTRKVSDGFFASEETLQKSQGYLLIALFHLFILCVLNREFNTWNMWYIMRILFLPFSIVIILYSVSFTLVYLNFRDYK